MLRHELIGAQFVRGELPSVCDLAQGFPERWSWVVQYSWIDVDQEVLQMVFLVPHGVVGGLVERMQYTHVQDTQRY